VNRSASFFRRHAGLLAAFGAAAAAVIGFYLLILWETGGRFIYTLDDAYIHLAIAKHIVQNGVWGVTPYGFSSSSSSILWPLLLAGVFRLAGIVEILPLLINILVTAIFIGVLYHEWISSGRTPKGAFLLLIGWMLLFPLGPIFFNGMETMLQSLAVVMFAAAAVRYLAKQTSDGWILLGALAGFATLVRYEACFAAAAVVFLLLLRRRWKAAVWVGICAAAPVVIYGIFSVSQGWFFVPNSLLIKYGGVPLSSPAAIWNLLARPFLPVADIDVHRLPLWQLLAVAALVLLLLRARAEKNLALWDARVLPVAVFLLVAVMHSLLITAEIFYRYGAYLNALGLWAIGCLGLPAVDWQALRRNSANVVMGAAAAGLVGIPMVYLATAAIWKTPVAARNIWQQQYQMGSFLKEYYPQGRVAANDIGAIDYLADLHLTDLIGLADREVLVTRMRGDWVRDMPGSLATAVSADGARIAVIYDGWFNYNPKTGAAVPAQWVRVASWTIPGNVVCGGATVTWYAIVPEEAAGLRSALEQFQARLPEAVTVQYFPLP
jgi:hypothetical protein